jgi:hypothetical protein
MASVPAGLRQDKIADLRHAVPNLDSQVVVQSQTELGEDSAGFAHQPRPIRAGLVPGGWQTQFSPPQVRPQEAGP